MEIRSFYRDEHLAVVEKPAGVLVHPRPGMRNETTLLDVLKADTEELGGDADQTNLVHRLDRGTSGLMIVALSKLAARTLNKSFAERSVSKGYLALVYGAPEPAFSVDAPLGKVLPRPAIWGVDWEHGLKSHTDFETLWTAEDCSLLAVKPITGRTHQIRIHSAYKGHPIVGDSWYSRDYIPGRPWQKYLHKNARRLCLHAYRLEFSHPVYGAKMTFWCPPPPEFLEILRQLSGNTQY